MSNVTNLTRSGDNTVEMRWEMLQRTDLFTNHFFKKILKFASYFTELQLKVL